jgi:galactokinase
MSTAATTDIISHLETVFKQHFHTQPIIVRSPGRVNLIGEHTDYNEGFVLPAAVDKAAYVALTPRQDDNYNWIAADLNDSYSGKLPDIQKSDKGWPNYLSGMVDQLIKAGYKIRGFDCVITANVPIGAGMSSSAALECAVGFALSEAFNLNISKMELVKLGQKVENEFVGVKSGIMDQFASVFGKKDHVIRLDCRSLEYEYFPFKMQDIRIVLCDTGVKHSLVTTEYNTRREQCEAGVKLLQSYYPEVKSLRDVTRERLEQHRMEMDPIVYNRCLYVVEENARLLAATEDLQRGDMASFGNRMYLTHYGLRDLYEVSVPELDYLVEFTEKEDIVLGARMMGGGFGGCTINLVKEDNIEAFFDRISKAYKRDIGIDLKIYDGKIEDGTSLIKL